MLKPSTWPNDENRFLTLWVPRAPEGTLIDRGSGIVGRESSPFWPTEAGWVRVDFESNRYGAQNIVTYADRCWHAAGRHMTAYGTVARAGLLLMDLVPIGRLWGEGIELFALEALANWLGPEVGHRIAVECQFSDSRPDERILWWNEHPFWRGERRQDG